MKQIVWDVDDVLNNLTAEWYADYCSVRTDLPLFNELICNPPCDNLGISLQEYQSSLDKFRLEKMPGIKPRPQVLAWFEQHGMRCSHVALTAVPLHLAHLSAAWVMKHYGKWIRSFHVIPSARAGFEYPCYDISKADYMKTNLVKTCLFIDDSKVNITQALAAGIESLAFPAPWNNATDKPIELLLEEVTESIASGEDTQ